MQAAISAGPFNGLLTTIGKDGLTARCSDSAINNERCRLAPFPFED